MEEVKEKFYQNRPKLTEDFKKRRKDARRKRPINNEHKG